MQYLNFYIVRHKSRIYAYGTLVNPVTLKLTASEEFHIDLSGILAIILLEIFDDLNSLLLVVQGIYSLINQT